MTSAHTNLMSNFHIDMEENWLLIFLAPLMWPCIRVRSRSTYVYLLFFLWYRLVALAPGLLHVEKNKWAAERGSSTSHDNQGFCVNYTPGNSGTHLGWSKYTEEVFPKWQNSTENFLLAIGDMGI